VPRTAWSPDGRWIAMDRWGGFNEVPGEGDPPYGPQITAVGATGGSAVRGPFPAQDADVLGWRDPDHVLNAVVGNQQGTTGLIAFSDLGG